jgi:hypothetical protein
MQLTKAIGPSTRVAIFLVCCFTSGVIGAQTPSMIDEVRPVTDIAESQMLVAKFRQNLVALGLAGQLLECSTIIEVV